MNYNDYFKNLSDDEIIKKIYEEKKQNIKSLNWKEKTVVFVSDYFNVDSCNLEVKFYEGKYQAVFKKIDIPFSQFCEYVEELKDNVIYQEAKEYINNVIPFVKSMEIDFLEARVNQGEMSEDEKKHHTMTKINKTLTKVIVVVIVFATIYALFTMLMSVFGYSFK